MEISAAHPIRQGVGNYSRTRHASGQLLVHSRPDEFGLRYPAAFGLNGQPSLHFLGQVDGGSVHAIYSAIRGIARI